MTTVAIKGRVVATDSAAFSPQGVFVGTMRKLARSPAGDVVACSGPGVAVAAMLRWVEEGMDGSPSIDDDFHALLARPDGTVCEVGGDGTLIQIDAPFHAGGTGRQIAIGAMAKGATAEEAVQIACRWHGGSREPVQTMRLGEPA